MALSLVALLAMAYAGQTKKDRSEPNRPPVIGRFTASQTTFRDCPYFKTTDNPEPNLLVVASDPDGDTLSYEYSADTGTISGKGRAVIWKLGSWAPGLYHVKVKVTDGKGGEATSELTVKVVDHAACDPPKPPCPFVGAALSKNGTTFSVIVKGAGFSYQSLSFSWTVIHGKIVAGQNTQSIEVKGDPKEDNLTATVRVTGLPPACDPVISGTLIVDVDEETRW